MKTKKAEATQESFQEIHTVHPIHSKLTHYMLMLLNECDEGGEYPRMDG